MEPLELSALRNEGTSRIEDDHGDDASLSHTDPPTTESNAGTREYQGLKHAYKRAACHLHTARFKFAGRKYRRDRMQYENRMFRQQSNVDDDISTDFLDLLWVKENQKLTRALIEAEDAVSNAKHALTQAGHYTAAAGLSSLSGSDWTEEDPAYFDAHPIASVTKERIYRWLSAVSEVLEDTEAYPSRAEVDWWDAAEVACGEGSWDTPDPRDGSKIREWQRKCGQVF